MEIILQKNADIIFLRLEPGMELMEGIKAGCAAAGVKYGTIISCIGSLKQTAYTYAQRNPGNISGITYRHKIVTDKPNELISGQGTIGITDGEADVHLHALMCDVDGTLFAGHMMPGSIICATMEVSIAVAKDGTIEREFDPVMKLPIFHFSAQ